MSGEDFEVPIFLKWSYPEEADFHIFMRSDWVMGFLFDHIPQEDAMRVWTKMCYHRICIEEGEEAAQEFLDAFGVKEH